MLQCVSIHDADAHMDFKLAFNTSIDDLFHAVIGSTRRHCFI